MNLIEVWQNNNFKYYVWFPRHFQWPYCPFPLHLLEIHIYVKGRLLQQKYLKDSIAFECQNGILKWLPETTVWGKKKRLFMFQNLGFQVSKPKLRKILRLKFVPYKYRSGGEQMKDQTILPKSIKSLSLGVRADNQKGQ